MTSNPTFRQIGLFGGLAVPKEGLKAVGPIVFDWSAKGIPGNADAIAVDFRTQQTTQALISQAMAVFVDNRVGSDVLFQFDSGMVLVVKANTQGYFPIAQGNPVRFTGASAAALGKTNVFILNYQLPPYSWSV